MNIVCIGGGPAGLYFALLMKQQDPAHEITVVERNRPYDTFGWGVVFSDQTLGNMQRGRPGDAPAQILDSLQPLGRHRGQHPRPQDRARAATASAASAASACSTSCRRAARSSASSWCSRPTCRRRRAVSRRRPDHRQRRPQQPHPQPATPTIYKPDIDLRDCRFVWLGTHKLFDAFTFAFEETEHGWFQAHAYRFDDDTSTFIVETPRARLARAPAWTTMEKEEAIAFCEKLFASYLRRPRADVQRHATCAARRSGSASRASSASSWVHHNGRAPVVLMGDAAHTAHFSIGSGTKLALEDAIELAALHRRARRATSAAALRALRGGAQHRGAAASRTRRATRPSGSSTSTRYVDLPPEQFAYSLLTRSQRISHENLRLRDKGYVEGYEDWIAAQRPAAARRRTGRCRRCSRRSRCAARHAEEPRRRLADGAVLAASTACPATTTWCTWARARWAAPAWWWPR